MTLNDNELLQQYCDNLVHQYILDRFGCFTVDVKFYRSYK